MLKTPLGIAITVFFVYVIVLGVFAPQLSCVDGWNSPSIGRSGACSYHGGIDHTYENFVMLSGLLLAFFVWHKAKKQSDLSSITNNPALKKIGAFIASILKIFDSVSCKLWNAGARLALRMNLAARYKKHPWLWIAAIAILLAYIPLLILVILFFGIVAARHKPGPENNYIIDIQE